MLLVSHIHIKSLLFIWRLDVVIFCPHELYLFFVRILSIIPPSSSLTKVLSIWARIRLTEWIIKGVNRDKVFISNNSIPVCVRFRSCSIFSFVLMELFSSIRYWEVSHLTSKNRFDNAILLFVEPNPEFQHRIWRPFQITM